MRPTAILFAIISFAVLSALAWQIGAGSAGRIEQNTRSQTGAALDAAGETWARLEIDGLIVRLSGEALSEAAHLRVLEILGRLLRAGRIEDTASVAAPVATEAPALHLEILRTGNNISLIGRVPSDPGPAKIIAAARAVPGVTSVTNLLETAESPVPEGWPEALEFSLGAIAEIPQGRIILGAGTAEIIAIVTSAQQKAALTVRLGAGAPQDLTLAFDITAPPPVIAPFAFAIDLSASPPVLTACTASTVEGRDRILSAATRAGATGPLDCRIGLGAPSLLWPRAIDLGIAALERMQGGSLRMFDTELAITAPTGLGRDDFAALAEDLRSALPPPFSLQTVLPGATDTKTPPGAAERTVFVAVLSPDGSVVLAGPVRDQMSDRAITSYAESLFGFGMVSGDLVTGSALPEGWPGRVLSALETLSLLKTGRIEVSSDTVTVSGSGTSESISLEVRDTLRLRLGSGDGLSVNVRFDTALVPSAEPALLPAQCEIRIATLLEASQIAFAPNSVEIEPDSIPVIDAIADILRQCPQTRIEVGGHTDNQGRESMNLGLSQSRADAALDALLTREVLIAEMTARGYGESQPIAANDTEDGRRKNRRIAFKLLEEVDEPD